MDYEKLGLKAGLEIHQQLEGKKLFCNCPTQLRDDVPDINLKRTLRASAGESGKIDIAALLEQQKNLFFNYESYSDSTCLVELDEEPPHNINQDALNTTLQLCKMLDSHVVSNVQVMRKTVVDGSNTSGFQRTALIALSGKLDDVGIQTICLEEDAAKIVSKCADSTTYRLDRLGIPLIEIATDPDIKTPEQARDVAAKIGMLLRSTGKAKRGIGTIRQDLNVSIKGGTRVEIKGAQELKLIPLLVENEVKRQQVLLELKNTAPDFKEEKIIDVTAIIKPKIGWMQSSLKAGDKFIAFKLKGFKGFLGKELMPAHRLGTELAGYAKTRGFGGIIHSDEDMKKYKFDNKEIVSLNKKLDIKEGDAWIMALGDKNRAESMIKDLLFPRLKQLKQGVPGEVRDAKPDATSAYMRPMPGGSRMYPETDVDTIIISKAQLSAIELPELIENISERFIKQGLGKDLATLLSKSNRVNLFDLISKKCKNVKPAFIAETLLPTLKEIERKEKLDTSKITDVDFIELFSKLDDGDIAKNSTTDILKDICNNKKDYGKYELMSEDDIEKVLKEVINANVGAPFNAIMGQAMAKLKGKADGKKVIELLKKLT